MAGGRQGISRHRPRFARLIRGRVGFSPLLILCFVVMILASPAGDVPRVRRLVSWRAAVLRVAGGADGCGLGLSGSIRRGLGDHQGVAVGVFDAKLASGEVFRVCDVARSKALRQ